MVTGPTPGQAFHESLNAATAGSLLPWDDLEGQFRDDIENAVKAAVEVASLGQAAELAAAMAEVRIVRAGLNELMRTYQPVSGGWASRTSIGRLRRIATATGITPPSHHDADREADELAPLGERLKQLVATLRRISDQQEASGHAEGAYATGCAATMVEALDGAS